MREITIDQFMFLETKGIDLLPVLGKTKNLLFYFYKNKSSRYVNNLIFIFRFRPGTLETIKLLSFFSFLPHFANITNSMKIVLICVSFSINYNKILCLQKI